MTISMDVSTATSRQGRVSPTWCYVVRDESGCVVGRGEVVASTQMEAVARVRMSGRRDFTAVTGADDVRG